MIEASQSKCFFLGPISSSVVALQTALARPWPAKECLAARILSFRVCPVFMVDVGGHFQTNIFE
jgi:hypothetical protein